MRWTLLLPFGLAACSLIGGGSSSSSDDDDDGGSWSWGEEEDSGGGEDDTGIGPSDEGGGGETGSGEGGGEGADEGGGETGSDSGGGGESLEGRSWRLDLVQGSWTQPEGLGALLVDFITHDSMVYLSSVSGSELRGRIGGATGSTQDECVPTTEFSGELDGERLSVSGSDPLYLGTGSVIPFFFTSFTLTGTLEDEGELLVDGMIDGEQDVRVEFWRWEETLDLTEPTEVCELMAGFGVSCLPCADGQAYCLPLRVEDLEGSLEDLVITPSEGC